ncbi:MAG: glyoxalase/bleomycin resistance protein/dioxygenase [Amycolatopsis sp.]|jgi:predicted enzyme related to lactoylglutathione lyase|uniref:VOC family protein n=1 Tax=Amycolatopsis sp. TaxID=37632 RepID=UPI002626CDA1|nr:VOC family protein [Amycolatopsis sp.]MCU1684121.1 glyoxalase/bleomycin resistance protein/dioxygenase [Amycolatopsis sp.]
MTFRDSPWPDGTPCWADVVVQDRKRAMAFYGGLFGWELAEGGPDTGGYTMASVDGRQVAGIAQAMDAAQPASWTTYLAVSDADKAVAAIEEAGGQIHAPVMDVLSLGRMAIAADPGGAVFGIWQSGDHTGFQAANRPGTVSWNECMTRDFDGAKAFYTKVFGLGVSDMSAPGFTYATWTVEGRVVGGVGALSEDMPAEIPAHWGTYFSARDTDAVAAKAVELGGTLTSPVFDSPQGRIALLTDDQGAPFRVIAPNDQSGSPDDWDDIES